MPYPYYFDLSGTKSFYEQLADLGIDPVAIPPFEALMINTLQSLLTTVIAMQKSLTP